jgi:hypothetical protein
LLTHRIDVNVDPVQHDTAFAQDSHGLKPRISGLVGIGILEIEADIRRGTHKGVDDNGIIPRESIACGGAKDQRPCNKSEVARSHDRKTIDRTGSSR